MLNKKYLQTTLLASTRRQVAGLSNAYVSQSMRFFTKTPAALAPSSLTNESFLSGTSAVYSEQMYDQWRKDPSSVHASWRAYFENVEKGADVPFQLPRTVGQQTGQDASVQRLLSLLQQNAGQIGSSQGGNVASQVHDAYKIMLLIRAFMTHGHYLADVDPLQLYQTYKQFPSFAHKFKIPDSQLTRLVDYKTYGFTEADLEREFYVDAPELAGLLRKKKNWKLKELIENYQKAYCGKIGVEYMHIPDREKCNWIRDKFEGLQFEDVPKEYKTLNLDRLMWADEFQKFIANKFNTHKRFGLEGCESFIPGLKCAFDVLVNNGVEKVIIGMPHRGRLNVLVNVVRKPLEQVFHEFQGGVPNNDEWGSLSGDVKYHLGTSYTKKYEDGRHLTTTLLANPSHLEAVNPVVLGRARAEQYLMGDTEHAKVVPIQIHGDAAFAGQGIVYETMQMQDLINFKVGGTIHVVVNNQIGFTTTPIKSRSGMYCTDIAKCIDAPIFHVNADSMEDVAKVFQIAAEYRNKYKEDVVIDLIGYRKMGHNELDAPEFTQPLMYKKVKQMVPVAQKYEAELISNGTVTQEQVKKMKDRIVAELHRAYDASKTHKFNIEDWQSPEWEAIKETDKFGKMKETGVPIAVLKDLGEKISTLPSDQEFHPQIKKIYDARRKSIAEGKNIDWGTGEALAFASLIHEGFHVRVTGQDVERGTFSHRHAVVFNQTKDTSYIPMNSIIPNAEIKRFQISNSHLSEFGVLGYEYGYAQTHPNTLAVWEAQFGDFANEAQVMIDCFIAAGEAKWNVKQGLVMLLPHGYDGNGPEHSSCRIERFLSLCDDDEAVPADDDPNSLRMQRVNMQVINPTTSAQFFHALRRQLRRPFRKPLVVASPKKLLKNPAANSKIEDFDEGLRFRRVIQDNNKNLVASEKVKKVILCSGQVHLDIEKAREETKRNDIAIIRVEQLCPFPFRSIIPELEKFKNAEVVWCQEEPKNQGAYSYVLPRLHNIQKSLNKSAQVTYAGRAVAAATATGYSKVNEQELKKLLQEAMK